MIISLLLVNNAMLIKKSKFLTSISKQIEDIGDFLIDHSLSKKLEELNNKFDTRN